MAGVNVSSVINAYKNQNEISKKTEEAKVTENTNVKSKGADYGKTVGEPELSDKAAKYYEQLKKKYGQYDFILVSSAEKENARANAGKYANSIKTVVLIDEEKIERMATDENYRKQYEAILSGASNQIDQIKAAAQSAGATLNGIVMQVNDDGTTSFFAALKKSNEAQRARIERRAEQKKLEKKEAQKKAEKEQSQERIQQAHKNKSENVKDNGIDDKTSNKSDDKTEGYDGEIVTIMADSLDSLLRKIEEYGFNERSNSIQTESELQIGQNIDFRG